MTRKEALAELVAKVEAGEWPSRGAYLIPGEFRPADPGLAFQGSLDAAKALHEAVLPGWDWGCHLEGLDGFGASVHLKGEEFVIQGGAQSSARAWLLVILHALHSMEQD